MLIRSLVDQILNQHLVIISSKILMGVSLWLIAAGMSMNEKVLSLNWNPWHPGIHNLDAGRESVSDG